MGRLDKHSEEEEYVIIHVIICNYVPGLGSKFVPFDCIAFDQTGGGRENSNGVCISGGSHI